MLNCRLLGRLNTHMFHQMTSFISTFMSAVCFLLWIWVHDRKNCLRRVCENWKHFWTTTNSLKLTNAVLSNGVFCCCSVGVIVDTNLSQNAFLKPVIHHSTEMFTSLFNVPPCHSHCCLQRAIQTVLFFHYVKFLNVKYWCWGMNGF